MFRTFHCALLCLPSCIALVLLAGTLEPAAACTNFIASKGATADGSVMVTYTCDGEFHPHLRALPAADHEPGAMQESRTGTAKCWARSPSPRTPTPW